MRGLLFLLFFTTFSYGQELKQQQRDSVAFYISHAKGSVRSKYLKKAITLSKTLQEDSLLRKSNIAWGLYSYYQKDTLGLKEANSTLRNLFYKNRDSVSLAKIYHFKALIFRIQNRLDSSFYYYHESKEISVQIKDSLEVGRRLLSMSNMQRVGGDYAGAEATIIEALQYLEPLNEINFTAESFNALGNVLIKTNRFDEAREYYQKTLLVGEKDSSERSRDRWWLLIANNIGNAYGYEERQKEGLPYYQKALQYDSLEIKFPGLYQLILGNYSEINYALGNTKEAWEGFWKLLKIREDSNNIYGQSISHNGLAYHFMNEGNREKALYHARKSYDLTKKVNNNFTRISALVKLANLTSGNESKKYLNEYIHLNDSIRNVELKLKNQFTKIRYETEKKEKENEMLKLENEQKQAAVEKAQQQRIIAVLVAVAFFLALVRSIVFYRSRRKKLLYLSQLEKAGAREEERQQIAKSLHDEVAGDLRMLHQKLENQAMNEEATRLEKIKENVRNLSHQLSSVSFEEVSFKDQMINLVTDYFSKDFKIFIKGIDEINWKKINETIKRTAYLCIRESLQNTVKYANANQFDVLFSMYRKGIQIKTVDNGEGFKNNGTPGIGLKNLQNRVREINGQLVIENSEEGTHLTISIPHEGKQN